MRTQRLKGAHSSNRSAVSVTKRKWKPFSVVPIEKDAAKKRAQEYIDLIQK